MAQLKINWTLSPHQANWCLKMNKPSKLEIAEVPIVTSQFYTHIRSVIKVPILSAEQSRKNLSFTVILSEPKAEINGVQPFPFLYFRVPHSFP